MKSKTVDKPQPVLLHIGLIFIIWLVTYIIYQFTFKHELGWDEVSYLSSARGIAENFDFSSRSTTIMGLIKYPFPQHTHHYPLLSTYIAIFFKLFGVSIKVAYFSSWIAGLIACIFIYLTMILLTENYLLSFVFSVSFLFLPKILFYCDSAMMEVPGAALLSILTFFIFKDIKNGKINPFLMAICALWLYLYKSLFVGVVFGLIVVIISAYKSKPFGFKNESKSPFWISLTSFLGLFITVHFILTKFLFLPLAPYINMNPKSEAPEGTYADFLGGFCNDVPGNLVENAGIFYSNIIASYFPYNTAFLPGNDAFFIAIPAWYDFLAYFLVYFYTATFTVILWQKLNPAQRLFILYTVISIIIFNMIFWATIGSGVGLISRYNLVYLPLLITSSGIILNIISHYLKPFVLDHKQALYVILVSLIVFVYLPYYYSSVKVIYWDKDLYHGIGHKNAEVVKKFTNNSNPMFVYFTVGTHTTWDSFPMKIVYMEAINEQIKRINLKLPRPIEYLFLHPGNNLFKINQELILKGLPIIDNWYTLLGVDPENNFVVYKYNPKIS